MTRRSFFELFDDFRCYLVVLEFFHTLLLRVFSAGRINGEPDNEVLN